MGALLHYPARSTCYGHVKLVELGHILNVTL
jgi:hypothetical protein